LFWWTAEVVAVRDGWVEEAIGCKGCWGEGGAEIFGILRLRSASLGMTGLESVAVLEEEGTVRAAFFLLFVQQRTTLRQARDLIGSGSRRPDTKAFCQCVYLC